MRISPVIIIVSALLLISACATTEITAKRAFEENAQENLQISQVAVEALPNSEATPTIVLALKSAVQEQLAARNVSGQPARLEMVVTFVEILSQGERILLGALAGANKLNVTATVISQSDDNVLAEFEIMGAHNPAVMGAFTDQEVSTAESVAKSLVEEIYGKKN